MVAPAPRTVPEVAVRRAYGASAKGRVRATNEDYFAINERLQLVVVADGRLYIGQSGNLQPLTKDSSWMATILATNPETDPAVLHHHPMRHSLTNVVGSRSAADVHIVEQPLSGGEMLLLTTDGVHGV